MKTDCAALNSSVGKKVFMALSGIALMLFLIVHLGGNLTLFACDGGALFNSYAHHLESVGPLLYVAEAGLLAIFLLHVFTAFGVTLDKKRARPDAYAVTASKGGNSKMTVASKSMIYTGVILLLFIPLHIWMFKFNAGQGFTFMDVHGKEMKDLYLVVLYAFADPAKAWAYAAVMFLLGFHLRHGFWSSLQSLGAMSPKMSPVFYCVGLLFAVLMAAGFLALPLYLLYFGPDPATLRPAVEAVVQTGGAL
jgi:succinate dehydrogenase / fumarate reductase cytochrome b subunit